jgi:hypothetical protein
VDRLRVASGADKVAVESQAHARFGDVPILVSVVSEIALPDSFSLHAVIADRRMIRYRENRRITPPAPFVHVTLRCLQAGTELTNQPAHFDRAAHRRVLPGKVVEAWKRLPLDAMAVGGFGGQVLLLPTLSCRTRNSAIAAGDG